MKTPICDFVKDYAENDITRMHMPGHKGKGSLCERLDITEIKGADSLYEADGIIAESEKNASRLFGCRTFYSTEGSSHTIRAMLYLTSLYAKESKKRPLILAARNAHKAFLSALALLDLDVLWLTPKEQSSYLSVNISPTELDSMLCGCKEKPTALYITSPDYLGGVADVRGLSEVCRKHGLLLLVDNAHGAYLHFLSESYHPITLGADISCDSAHKTLPVLTGGAYLHISDTAPKIFTEQAKSALALFGSSSPSYLILQSLDAANAYIADDYNAELSSFIFRVNYLRNKLKAYGYTLFGNEPIKLTISAKPFGYRGFEIAELLRKMKIECEFCDADFIVLMLTPSLSRADVSRLENALLSIEKRAPITEAPPEFFLPTKAMSVRDAILSPCEKIATKEAVGRVLAQATVGCPPAVPIIMSGEIIDKNAVKCFDYYGIDTCFVVK